MDTTQDALDPVPAPARVDGPPAAPPRRWRVPTIDAFRLPPPSVSRVAAAVMEPLLAVLGFVVLQRAFGQPMTQAADILCIITMLLAFPGVDRFHDRPAQVLLNTTLSWLVILAILLLIGVATSAFGHFRSHVLLSWMLLTPVLQTGFTLVGGAWLRHQARHPALTRPALVVGAGSVGRKVADALRADDSASHQFVGYIDDRDPNRCAGAETDQVVGGFDDVVDCIQRLRVKDVYLALPLSAQPRIARLVEALRDCAVSIYFVPDVFAVPTIQGRMHTLQGVPVVGLLESPFTGINGAIKRASDVVLALLILVLVSPVMAAVALGVKLSSPGPVLFKQRRNGLDGEEILVFKFRSMRTMDNGAVIRQATRGDPRITPFGAFIRRTSLDELPQFLNVLQGTMSIVGPRPHAVAHNQQYRAIISAYMLRHKVKPGITGWAQVNGYRGETDRVEKMQARVAADIEYLQHWSLGLDLRIIARTVLAVLFDRSAY